MRRALADGGDPARRNPWEARVTRGADLTTATKAPDASAGCW